MQTNSITNQRPTLVRFPLGETYITPGAEEALMIAGQTGIEFLRRHTSCDFGELSDEDLRENEISLREGFRVLRVRIAQPKVRSFGSSQKPIAARQPFSYRTNTEARPKACAHFLSAN